MKVFVAIFLLAFYSDAVAQTTVISGLEQAVERLDEGHTNGTDLLFAIVLIALATYVSEDLACVGAGMMAAHGMIGYSSAALASFIGIFTGDLLLYAAGYYLGRPALRHRPFKWIIGEDRLEESARWFEQKGPMVIILSRFVPGSRLPAYFMAGVLHKNFWKFFFYFFVAAAVWVPLLVWLAMILGTPLLDLMEKYRMYTVAGVIAAALLVWIIIELIIPLFSFRGRRLLLSSWRRKTRWEFWPPWIFYPPVVLYIIYLAIKHRSVTVFTASNPAIPAGGFVGESKMEILAGLHDSGDAVARYALLEATLSLDQRLEKISDFMKAQRLDFPLILKPDVGQRGLGVAVVRSESEIRQYFSKPRAAVIVQEYIPGYEFGVFYYRYPNEERGHVFSITEKRFPAVVGDGRHNLEYLILKDDRAVCMAHFFLKKWKDRLSEIPEKGERVQLVELGTHCRGAVFYDGEELITPELEKAIDDISHRFKDFYFGRYDIRTPSLDGFRQGRDFKIIELNGVTSEATHIYHPGHSLWYGHRTLMKQWRIAFEIGAINRARGVQPLTFRALLESVTRYKPSPEA